MSSGLVDPNDPPLPEVERRAALLRDLLRQSGWKVTAEVADAGCVSVRSRRSSSFPLKRRSLLSAQGLHYRERIGGEFTTESPHASLASLTNLPSTPSKPVRVHFRHRHRNLEAGNRKGGRFRMTALQNRHSN